MNDSNDNSGQNRTWGGRFSESTDKLVEAFSASVQFDARLYAQDIAGSIAHARMLGHCGILPGDSVENIVRGLGQIRTEIENNQFHWRQDLEDVHMNIESRLIELIGEDGKKLHTGRSRNDQVATDLRLYLREVCDELTGLLRQTQQALIALAEQQADTVMPGFTHMQVAQPVSFGHHMLAWQQMLDRDTQRLQDCRKRINVMPLGSAALGGTVYPIDRAYAAGLLGFDAISENSLDAVSDRDFTIEFASDCSLIMMHLSRMAEEMILWSSPAYGFIELPDRFCTGSSIMPQKKNPDVPELVRGKTARVYGNLISLLTLMKGQPLAYNRDNQEDKEPVFDSIDTVFDCLQLYAAMIPAIQVNAERCRAALERGHATATDMADYLVGRGVAFRDAHEIVGKAVALAESKSVDLSELALKDLQSVSPEIREDVFDVLRPEGSMAARNHPGGTAPDQVRAAAGRARDALKPSK